MLQEPNLTLKTREKLPKTQGSEEIPLIHRHMNPWLLHCVLRCTPRATHIPQQIIHKNMNKTRTLMETTPCPAPPQLQDRRTLLQGQPHTGGITLHGQHSKPSRPVAACAPDSWEPGSQNSLRELPVGKEGQMVRCLLHILITPAPSAPPGSGGMGVTSLHPSKELIQELIQPPKRDK